MKWLKKILSFGTTAKIKQTQPHKCEKIGRNMIQIKSLDIFGNYKESCNGTYILVLQDSDRESGVCGFRNSGKGSFALLKGEELIFVGECERPSDGIVSNNGVFMIIDTLFGDKLASKVYIYNQNGEIYFSYMFYANTLNIGISDDGKYAAVQLLKSDSDDSNKLCLIDIQQEKIICSFKPQTRVAQKYEFSISDKIVYLCYENNRRYRYTLEGVLLDSDRYDKEIVEDATPENLLLIIKERLKSATADMLPTLLVLADRALKKSSQENRALAHRLKGEIYENMNNHHKAIEFYKIALEIDPKVGVKRKLQKLEKKLME